MLITALALTAHGATLVLHDGDADAAARDISELVGIPLPDLEPRGFDTLKGMSGGSLDHCEADALEMDDLRSRLATATSEYDAGNFEEGRSAVDKALSATVCLREWLDPSWAWQAHFLRGVLAWGDGDKAAAKTSWTHARRFDPTRSWDADFAPIGQAMEVFATAIPEGVTTKLTVVGATEIRVDGRESHGITVTLGSERQLLQWTDPFTTATVSADGAASLVLEPVTPLLDDLSRHQDLVALLAAALPGERAAYAVVGGKTWRIAIEDGYVEELVYAPAPVVTSRPVRWSHVSVATGSIGVVVGAIVGGLAYSTGVGASKDGRTASRKRDPIAWDAAREDYENARGQLSVGWWIGGIGGGIAAVGVTDLLVTQKVPAGITYTAPASTVPTLPAFQAPTTSLSPDTASSAPARSPGRTPESTVNSDDGAS